MTDQNQTADENNHGIKTTFNNNVNSILKLNEQDLLIGHSLHNFKF
jgi:hypothetical protein